MTLSGSLAYAHDNRGRHNWYAALFSRRYVIEWPLATTQWLGSYSSLCPCTYHRASGASGVLKDTISAAELGRGGWDFTRARANSLLRNRFGLYITALFRPSSAMLHSVCMLHWGLLRRAHHGVFKQLPGLFSLRREEKGK